MKFLTCLLTLVVLQATKSSAESSTEDEEEWIRTYGTHKNDSGKWPLARNLFQDYDRLGKFCVRVHERWTGKKVESVDAHVSFWLITFTNRSMEPIWVDMMMYAENKKDIGDTEFVPYHCIIKGNRPDCVFYMKELKQHAKKMSEMGFSEHVCGVDTRGFENFTTRTGEDKLFPRKSHFIKD